MKKAGIIIVSILLCISVSFFVLSSYNNSVNQYKPSQGEEELYALTEQEVARMNANSNFLGCVLLDESAGTNAIAYPIKNGTSDTYYCFAYRGENCITDIKLISEDANLYGISVGDSLEKMAFVMQEQGFFQQDAAAENAVGFEKYYIIVVFEYNEENVINSIGLYVEDPAYQGIVY